MAADLTFFLQQNPAYFALVCGIVGLVVGSFLNVVIHRLPIMLERTWRSQCAELEGTGDCVPQEAFNLAIPRSRCPHCSRPLSPIENIPLLSYLLQGGKCRGCGAPISFRYPLVEALSAAGAVAVALHFGVGWTALWAIALTWALLALTFIDFDHHLLPDAITLPFLWLGLLLSLGEVFVDTRASIIGAAAGYLVLWGVYQAFRLTTGKEGMGYGDFKLLAMLGAWLGWQALPVIILLSSVVGAMVGIALIAFRGHDRSAPIPFGPYLAAAGWLALLWGDALTAGYLDWVAASSLG